MQGLGMIAAGEIFSSFASQAISGETPRGIHFGVQLNAFPINPNRFQTFLDVLGQIKNVGYQGFESSFRNLSPQFAHPAPARRDIEQTGLTFFGIHIFFPNPQYDQATRIAAPAVYEPVAHGGAALGAKHLILSGAPCENREQLKRKIEALDAAGRYARSAGLTAAYHNEWWEFKSKIGEIEALYTQTHPELVQFVLEAGHAYHAGANVPQFIHAHYKRIIGFHLRDFKNGQYVELGTGTFPLREVAQTIIQIGWKGFAYNIFGNGNTVVRGGYGLFYGYPEGLLYQRTDAMQPIDLYLNIPAPKDQWENIYTASNGYPNGAPFPRGHVTPSQFKTYRFILPLSGGVMNPGSHVEYTQDYNFTIEQNLSNNFALSVAYVGDRAEHVMASRQFNPAVYTPGAGDTVGNENSRRLFSGLAAVELMDAYEYEMTNSLQVNVTRRSSRGLMILSNIVWSKTIDNNSAANEGNAGPPDPFNLQSGRGLADFDQAIRSTTSLNYMVPHFSVSHAADFFVNGWQANGILSIQSGLPINIVSGVDNSLSGIGADQADFVPGVSTARPSGASQIKEWFNTAAFRKNATGTFGNVPRNILRGPGYADLDMSLFKDIFPERRIDGQFQAEAFNVFNHTNLANSVSSVNAGSFGTINSTNASTGSVNMTSTVGAARIFQFAAKIIF